MCTRRGTSRYLAQASGHGRCSALDSLSLPSSPETSIATDALLLPGQKSCVGLPWERENLPRHGLPPGPPLSQGNPFDHTNPKIDPVEGWEIGLCQVIRQHQLDPNLVKAYAVDFCAVKTLKDATREQVEAFVKELSEWAEKDRNALLCQLNSYLGSKEGAA